MSELERRFVTHAGPYTGPLAFPADANDPLRAIYPLLERLYQDAAAYRGDWYVKPQLLQSGHDLIQRKDRHDVFVAAFRFSVWIRILRPKHITVGHEWRRASECLKDLTHRLTRSNPFLTHEDVLELCDYMYQPARSGSGFFPGRAFVAALEFYARSNNLPEVAITILQALEDQYRRSNNSIFDGCLKRIATMLTNHKGSTATPRYSIQQLFKQSASVTAPSADPPPFPAFPGDPLVRAYELVRSLTIAANAHIHPGKDKPQDYPPGATLLAMKPRHDAFVATIRWCVWCQQVANEPSEDAWNNWRGGLHCVGRLANKLAAGGQDLTLDEIEELSSYLVASKNMTGRYFPEEALVAGIEQAMRRRSEMASEAPIGQARRIFDELVHEAKDRDPNRYPRSISPGLLRIGSLTQPDRQNLLRFAREKTEILFDAHRATWASAQTGSQDLNYREYMFLIELILKFMTRCGRWEPNDIDTWIKWTKSNAHLDQRVFNGPILHCIEQLEDTSVSAAMAAWLETYISEELLAHKPDQKLLNRLHAPLRRKHQFILEPGEAWSDRVIADLEKSSKAHCAAWHALFSHIQVSAGSSPSLKWSKVAKELLKPVGKTVFAKRAAQWFPLVDKPRTSRRTLRSDFHIDYTNLIIDPHMDLLKGLCWIAATIPNPDLARALARLALSAYRKVPGLGPRAVKVGNAAVYALGQMPGMDSLGQLAMLRVKVKFGTAQKGIEKALNAAAKRENLPREEIEELGIPTYGLTRVGLRTERLGVFEAELSVSGGDTALIFFKLDKDGKRTKPVKSIPAAIKSDHAEELKDLKAAAKDIAAMLPAQRDRIDSMFLDNKSWPLQTWQDRYLNHPLVGALARRLVWVSPLGWPAAPRRAPIPTPHSFTFLNDSLVDHTGAPITLDPAAIIQFWHPINSTTEEVLAWRRFFEDRQIKQPFKQAHREVYLLTDAERRTETYSNRFAAHVIKQHQFHALCGIRNWKNRLRLLVDDEYPPATRTLAAHNIRAEFWIEGIGDDFGAHTNESGAFHHLATDQVRFYPIEASQASAHAGGGGYGAGWRQGALAAGIKLEEIPPLVFSEIMRDVDLFVGVASVANNPNWNDGGPGGTHRDYWWTTSFGDLSQSGAGRHDLLSRLLPRLKIAPQCSLADKFLTVRGKLRTYKIHLGSGNILMEPNDQYLCIVPGRNENTNVFLPFEGDRTLAIILSKAFMLAEDDKISDTSIKSQIAQR